MRALLFAFGVLGVLALTGCKGFHPVGPLAKKVPITQQGKELPAAPTDTTASASSRVPAVKPTPPTMLVKPEDVDATNGRASAAKLSTELTTDSQNTVNAPVTVQISRVKGGIK